MKQRKKNAAIQLARSMTKILCSYTLIMHVSVRADEVSFSTKDDWETWNHPNGALEINTRGYIKPMAIRKDIDAVKNARQFGGGIRAVGSNPTSAQLVLDEDLSLIHI